MRDIPLPIVGAVRDSEGHTSANGWGREGPANFTTSEMTLILESCTARESAQSNGMIL